MRISDLEDMNFEELWRLHEELTRVLAEKIVAEKLELERRLARLNRSVGGGDVGAQIAGSEAAAPHRYPKVPPKYRNPDPPGETWSGRGKRPRWLVKALGAGRQLEEFRIAENGRGAGASKTPDETGG